MLGLGDYLEALDKGAFGIFGEGLVADDFAVFVYCHDAIGSYYVPAPQVHLETSAETVLVNQAYLHFRCETSQRDESTDA